MKDIIEKVIKDLEEEINKTIIPLRNKRNEILFKITFIIAINIKYINTPKLLEYNKMEH